MLPFKKSIAKTLVLEDEPSKEALKEAFQNYKPKGIKDFAQVCLLQVAAEKHLSAGNFEGPGVYTVGIKRKNFWKVTYHLSKRDI